MVSPENSRFRTIRWVGNTVSVSSPVSRRQRVSDWRRENPPRAIAFEPLPQVLALDEVHHQVLPLAFDDEVVGHAWEIGMAQAGEDIRFAPELSSVVFGGEEILFYGNDDAEVGIFRLKHLPHSASTQNAIKAVAVAQHGSDLERHGCPEGEAKRW